MSVYVAEEDVAHVVHDLRLFLRPFVHHQVVDGQRFAFQGYLPAKEAERTTALRNLESESRKWSQTQIFIETPYRNRAMFDAILNACQPGTRLTVATDLTQPREMVRTQTIMNWKKQTPPDIERRPTVFLLLA